LDASYTILQHSLSSAAGEAISKLAVRFAAGTDELAQLVGKGQDLTDEITRLDKIIVGAVSKPPDEPNPRTEDQIRKRIEEIKLELGKLEEVFDRRYPPYVALSKPQPLTIEQIEALLADDAAIDLDEKSYVWVITKDRARVRKQGVTSGFDDPGCASIRQRAANPPRDNAPPQEGNGGHG
jgi:hypothetical protein